MNIKNVKGKIILFLSVLSVCIILLFAFFLLPRPLLSSTTSVKEFIDSRNGDLGVEHIVALTEISSEYDLVFYYISDSYVTANFLIKDENGMYEDLVMTSGQSSNQVNSITSSTRQLNHSEKTLYWGIAQSPEWTINHPNSHQIVVDGLVLGYYLHNQPLDEEILDLKFVRSEP